jgi:hypothetical protein
MATVDLAVKIIGDPTRAEALLAAVGKELGTGAPDRGMPDTAHFLVTADSAEDAREDMLDALEAAGDDWDEHLLFKP